MTVPKLPPWDARSANNAWASLRKPDGSLYNVFQNQAYQNFIAALRTQRDVVASHDVQLKDQKKDLDANSQAIIELTRDMQVLKEAPAPRPFP